MTDIAAPSRFVGLVDYARREPGRCLAVVLVLWALLFGNNGQINVLCEQQQPEMSQQADQYA